MADNGERGRRRSQRWLWAAAGFAAAGAVLAGMGIFHLPDRMYPVGTDGGIEARAVLQSGLLTAAAALVAVAGGLIALDETRQANAEIRRANTETKRANEAADTREREANANAHVRELYTAAINMLGADTVDVRLGGIYALERVAVDSAADQRTVVEVLSAFVREHAPRASGGPDSPPPLPGIGPATDVQAALTVLGRLPLRDDIPRGDLRGANLAGAKLSGAVLPGASLGGVNLTGARLNGADLRRVWLDQTNLTGLRLVNTNLTGALLTDANLTDALLIGADLTDARDLTQEQVDSTHGDGWTRLPEGLVRPASWGPEEPPDG